MPSRSLFLLTELVWERSCSAVLVVAIDSALDFALGLGLDLDARGKYGTIFIGNEGANKEVLQEEAMLTR